MNKENEVWKDITGYEGKYQVSNTGFVRSLNYHREGKTVNLKPQKDRGGYLTVNLYNEDVVMKSKKIHRLVYETFNGPIPKGLQVNHINEIKTDNRLENLNLMTAKENVNYGKHNENLSKSLRNHHKSSKPVGQYTIQGELIELFPSAKEAQRQTGIKQNQISGCCNGQKHYNTAGGFIWKYI